MTQHPSWQDVYGGRLPDGLPPVPRRDTPYVDKPQCPEDCSGRHGLDSEIRCVSCHAVAYQDWWHEYRVNRGVNFHALKPVNGASIFYHADMPCPVCGGAFRK